MKIVKFLFIILIICFFNGDAHSQQVCDITGHYADFILVKRHDDGRRKFISQSVIKPQRDGCYSALVNDNTMFVYYLLSSFSFDGNNAKLLDIIDEKQMIDTYFADLKQDVGFNQIMSDFVHKTVDKSLPKDTITMDALLNVAVKYFSVVRVTDEGRYAGKVAVGLNDIKKTLTKRSPFLEAFAWTAILSNTDGTVYHLDDDYKAALKQIGKIELGINPDDRLLRAQGAMYVLMYNNPNLRAVLRTEFATHQAYLPFVLVE